MKTKLCCSPYVQFCKKSSCGKFCYFLGPRMESLAFTACWKSTFWTGGKIIKVLEEVQKSGKIGLTVFFLENWMYGLRPILFFKI